MKPRDNWEFFIKNAKRTASVVSRLIGDSHYVYPNMGKTKIYWLTEEYGHSESDLIIGKRSNGYDNVLALLKETRILHLKLNQNHYFGNSEA
nr:hypothetical protein [Mycoplasmopsis bovis]